MQTAAGPLSQGEFDYLVVGVPGCGIWIVCLYYSILNVFLSIPENLDLVFKRYLNIRSYAEMLTSIYHSGGAGCYAVKLMRIFFVIVKLPVGWFEPFKYISSLKTL